MSVCEIGKAALFAFAFYEIVNLFSRLLKDMNAFTEEEDTEDDILTQDSMPILNNLCASYLKVCDQISFGTVTD